MSRNDVRMYEQKFPEVDDVVMVQVKSIAESGAYVSLLEYNGIEGMILLSELSRRRIRSITKLIKVSLLKLWLSGRLIASRWPGSGLCSPAWGPETGDTTSDQSRSWRTAGA